MRHTPALEKRDLSCQTRDDEFLVKPNSHQLATDAEPEMRLIMKKVALALLLLGTRPAPAIDSQIIDFEILPDGSRPVEGLSISNQFLGSHGVGFAFEDKTYPKIAEKGWPINLTGQSRPFAFWGPTPPSSGNPDGPATNQNVGSFFITDGRKGPNNLGVYGKPPALLISLASPSSQVSGEIIDIDSNADAWSIEARNQQTQVVASVRLTRQSPNAGDGKATPWSFQRPSADIASLRIAYVGTETSVGWAMDNFCPFSAWAPAKLGFNAKSKDIQISIRGSFGKAYRIEGNSSLSSTNWTTIADIVLTNAPTQYYTEAITSNTPARFYRALAAP